MAFSKQNFATRSEEISNIHSQKAPQLMAGLFVSGFAKAISLFGFPDVQFFTHPAEIRAIRGKKAAAL